jgi:hypothetical protein
MKTSMIIAAIVALIITSGMLIYKPFSHEKKNVPDDVVVVFSPTLKFNDLLKIKHDVAEKGITLDFRNLEFDEKGCLKGIDFVVDCNDGNKGSAKNLSLTGNDRFGFCRRYSNKSKIFFATGSLNALDDLEK